MNKQKDQKGNAEIRKSDSKEGSGKNPNQGYSDRDSRDTIDYPENEMINEDRDLSSGSEDREPV